MTAAPRLAGLGIRFAQPVSYELTFEQAAGDWLWGHSRGELTLDCSSCEQAFGWPLKLSHRLRLVRTESEEKRHLSESEPYLVEDDHIDIHPLLEDEILLALPMIARCGTCDKIAAETMEANTDPESSSPFAVLKSLKFD